MVPIEVQAFGFLAIAVILLGAAGIVQWLPAAGAITRPLTLLLLVVAIALGIGALVITRP